MCDEAGHNKDGKNNSDTSQKLILEYAALPKKERQIF